VRLFALLCLIAAAVVLLGTSHFSLGRANEQFKELGAAIDATAGGTLPLKSAIETVLLPGMNTSSCEWGSSSYENEPKAWYGCWDYVSGDVSRVGKAVQSRLRSRGFDVSRTRTEFAVELTAVRNSKTVCVDVLARGFRDGRNTSPDEVNPDQGEVFVDIWMADQRDGSVGVCEELPAWQDE
jgi:hypothetical protein